MRQTLVLPSQVMTGASMARSSPSAVVWFANSTPSTATRTTQPTSRTQARLRAVAS